MFHMEKELKKNVKIHTFPFLIKGPLIKLNRQLALQHVLQVTKYEKETLEL